MRQPLRLGRLVEQFDRLAEASGRREMVAVLAELLGEAGADEAASVVYLCACRLAPVYEPVEIGMGERSVATAIARAGGVTRAEVDAAYARLGDLGLAAEEVLGRAACAPEPLPLRDVHARLRRIAAEYGAGSGARKIGQLADLLQRAGPRPARYLCRIPLARLRLGVGDPTILDALSVAVAGSAADRPVLERAYNLTSDLGTIARRYLDGGLAAVRDTRVEVGKPIRPALAERLPSPEAVIERLGRCAVEPKLDGFRCQVHKDGGAIRVFSRNLEEMSAMFPEIAAGVRRQLRARTAILDGEAVAYDPASGQYLPFQATTRRRRKHGVDRLAAELPLRLFVFDAMLLDDRDLTNLPYTERRRVLAGALAPGETVQVTEAAVTEAAAGLRDRLLAAVEDGLEGVVAKRLNAPYQAGRRNFNWVKLKRNAESRLQDTVDCVVLGYLFGRGKRAALGAGALLAGVYDPARDEFVTISKIGTGLSDRDWREVRARCDTIAVDRRPARVRSEIEPSVWVDPRVVVEVLADEITRSPVHTAGRTETSPGYALRFPRLVRFREDDKQPEDATTVDEIAAMYRQQTRAIHRRKGEA